MVYAGSNKYLISDFTYHCTFHANKVFFWHAPPSDADRCRK